MRHHNAQLLHIEASWMHSCWILRSHGCTVVVILRSHWCTAVANNIEASWMHSCCNFEASWMHSFWNIQASWMNSCCKFRPHGCTAGAKYFFANKEFRLMKSKGYCIIRDIINFDFICIFCLKQSKPLVQTFLYSTQEAEN